MLTPKKIEEEPGWSNGLWPERSHSAWRVMAWASSSPTALRAPHRAYGRRGEALAAEGFTVFGPRLEGHGTSMEDHARSTAQGWISSVE